MAAGCLSFRAGGIALRLLILLRGERTARPPSLASARALVRQVHALRTAHANPNPNPNPNPNQLGGEKKIDYVNTHGTSTPVGDTMELGGETPLLT